MASMCLYALPTTSGNAPDRQSLWDLLPDLDWLISQLQDSLWCYVVVVQQYTVSQRGRVAFVQDLLPHSRHMRLNAVMHQEEPRAQSTSLTGSHSGTFD